MTVKDFNRHKSSGGTAIATSVDEIRTFKQKKDNRYRAKSSSGRSCSKCSTSHPLRECSAFGKKCHKCGLKNHFSSCCRSKNKSQGDGNGRRPPRAKSTERCHRPKIRGRCLRSRSRSRSRSNTQSAHSIKLDKKDQAQQESMVKKMFNSISRSRSIDSTNDTDPSGRTKIITLLNIKLPHRDTVDEMKLKVNDGVEANIIPLDSFRSMFPHALNKEGYPKNQFLKGSRTNLKYYDNSRLVNHGSIKLRLHHYLIKAFQDHLSYVVETKTCKEIIVRHLARIRLGLVQVLCKKLTKHIAAVETKPKNSFQDHQLNIDGKILCRKQRSKSESHSDHSSSSSRSKPEKKQSESDRQTTSHNTGMSPLSRAPNGACQKLTPFKTPGSDMLTSFKTPESDTLTPFKTPQRFKDTYMLTSFKTLVKRVTKLNAKYMVPVNEVSLVISDPQKVKLAPLPREQPSKGPPQKGLRFNLIYIEPGSTSILSTRDLQALVPNSFDCIGDYVRRIRHQN